MLALFGAGCGGGGGHSAGNAYVYVQWTLADVGNPAKKDLSCPQVGGGDVVLTMVNNATQQTYTDTFPCTSTNYAGTSAYLPSGTYSITMSLYGDMQDYGNTTTLLDQLVATETLLGGENDLGPTDFQVNSFGLGWVVTSGGLASSCAAVGANFVELDVYYSGQTQATAYYLDCYNYSPPLYTLSIPLGTYNVQWQAFLVDANYHDVPGSIGTQLTSYTVSTGVQANLGTAYFAF
jgi:hypothetical protein